MKKKFAFLVAVAAGLSVALMAGAAPSPKATGDITNTFYNPTATWSQHYVFNAIPTDFGTSTAAKGQVEIWEYSLPSGTLFQHFIGTVTCYSQPPGNTAYFSGQVIWVDGASVSSQQLPNKPYYRVGVQDNGEPGTSDEMSFNRNATAYGGSDCGLKDPSQANAVITAGNLQVHAQYSAS